MNNNIYDVQINDELRYCSYVITKKYNKEIKNGKI